MNFRRTITAVLLLMLCVAAPSNAEYTLPIHGKVHYSIASWYGHNFHGKTTASGALFNMHDFTCAHRTFPFGSWLKITNMVNRKSTFCVVNDRGPFEAVRDVDVSYAAATVLDMISLGICAVRIEYLGIDSSYTTMVRELLHSWPFLKYFRED
jgi:rare lipoprotein A (peptidoglycan hydrolase)